MFWYLINILAIVASVTVLGLSIWLDPDPRGFGTHEQLGLPPCEYLVQSGDPCLTCGMTTSFANMAQANVPAAFKANPAGVALFVITLAMPFWFGHALWTRRDPFRFTIHPVGRWVLPVTVLFLVACWVVRTSLEHG